MVADVAEHVRQPAAISGRAHAVDRLLAERDRRLALELFRRGQKEDVHGQGLGAGESMLASEGQRLIADRGGPREIALRPCQETKRKESPGAIRGNL